MSYKSFKRTISRFKF